jgi:hypothetical protein
MPNVTVYDIETYPDNGKTVTVQLSSIVPVGAEGDEKWVISSSTTGYSDNTARTAIQDLYIREIKAGWFKSSGLAGGTFDITSSSKTIGVKMDASNYTYYIELEEGYNLTGDAIAADMEEKIRAIPDGATWNSADTGYQLSYKNCIVEFVNNRFYIVSGDVAPYYTGASRSSVYITSSGVDTAYTDLGFELGVDSQTMAGLKPREVLLASNYTSGSATMVIGNGTGAVDGDVFYITDGTNSDYFIAISVSGTTLTVPVSGTNSFEPVAHSYTANSARVQRMMPGDPTADPTPYYVDVDSLVRFGIKSMANQLDFSS